MKAKKLPHKTTVWNKYWGNDLLVQDFSLCISIKGAKENPSSCLKLGEVCKDTQTTSSLLPEPWIMWNEGSDRRANRQEPHRTYNNSTWQHWHCIFGSVFWPALVYLRIHSGPVPSIPSSIYALQVVSTYADDALLLSQISLHKPLREHSSSSLSWLILFDFMIELVGEGVLTWAALLLFAGIPCGSLSTLHAHPGKTISSWSEEDLTQEDRETLIRGKNSSDLKVSYVAG